jgi:hypothetical protein
MLRTHRQELGALALVFLTGLTFGAALSRWLSENTFEHSSLFYQWLPTAILSTATAVVSALSALWLLKRPREASAPFTAALLYLPLLLPALYLLQPEVDTLRASVLLLGSLLLAVSLAAGRLLKDDWIGVLVPLGVFLLPLALYSRTLAPTVGQHDTFEFQVLSYQLGIAHPTGYPLYVVLGKLFTLIPLGNVAYRVNLSSAVFASLSVLVLYYVIERSTGDRLAAALGGLTFAFSYAFWSQAVEAEVYALNALFVSVVIYLLWRCFRGASGPGDAPLNSSPLPETDARQQRWSGADRQALLITLTCFVYGLSLTHHRTMLLLAPAMAIYALLHRPWHLLHPRRLLAGCTAFVAPVIGVHLFIPLRWWQIHGQPMAWHDFADLVLGTRFAAALRWDAILHDAERMAILLRSLLEQYPAPALMLAVIGLLSLLWKRKTQPDGSGWTEGLFLLLAFGGYAAFGLAYDVPDVSLFLIPASLVLAAALGIGISSLRRGADTLLARWHRLPPSARRKLTGSVTLTLVGLLPLGLISTNLPNVDKSDAFASYDWGKYVLQQDLPSGAVILADSEKMAPLHYLQTVERLRPDTETGVFPDEATNRAEVGRRLSEGRPVFLARFLPGLESTYHLRSRGPLVQVSNEPLLQLPADVSPLDAPFGDEVLLKGYHLDSPEVSRDGAVRLTLYWQAQEAVRRDYEVRLRLSGPSGHIWMETKGQTPVNGLYPTGAWRAGEVIPDFHEVDLSGQLPPGMYILQVGLFVPFGEQALPREYGEDGYLSIAQIAVTSSPTWLPSLQHPLRANFDEQLMLVGYDFPSAVIPGRQMPLTLYWQRIGQVSSDYDVVIELTREDGTSAGHATQLLLFGEYPTSSWIRGETLATTLPVTIPETTDSTLQLRLALEDPASDHRVLVMRGWLSPAQPELLLADVAVQPSPPSPADAEYLPANFEDKMWLLDYEIVNVQLRPGDALQLTLTWQALSAMEEDYTVFVHILDDDDRIWGQEDLQPARGTYPTSHWREGEVILDPHTVWTDQQAPPGLYRLEVGVYLLRTMERLYLVDDAGQPQGESLIIDLVEIVRSTVM